jgi:N-acetylglucosaminyl-diphospho-decaprenol L-rhamnosyltransferase
MSAVAGPSRAAPAVPSSSAGLGRIAAVVLNFRTPDATRRAIQSLLDSRRPPQQLILVDNGPVLEGLSGYADFGEAVRYVATERNLGFSGGMNVGIRLALAEGADAVLLVNSDATAADGMMAALEACLVGVPHGGIAGPVLRARATPDRVTSRGLSYDRRSGRMRDRVLERRTRADAPWQVVDALSGCVLLIRRAVFDAIGLLDEEYFYAFEDLDFCLTARAAGFSSLIVDGATAWHDGSHSIGPESPRRLYFATRNHLRLASRVAPSDGRIASAARAIAIVGLNTAHAMRSRGGSLLQRLRAVAAGTRDHLAGRYGDAPTSARD